MKKLLFAVALLCCCYFAQAQYNSLTIDNTTPCTVYVKIYGTTSTAIPACLVDYSSTVISIANGTTVTYANPSVVTGGGLSNGMTTLGSSDNFTMVRVYHERPGFSCIGTYADMSDCYTGTTYVHPWELELSVPGTGCTHCTFASLTYSGSGTTATLTIN